MKKIFAFLFFYYSVPSSAHVSHLPATFHQLEHLILILILTVVGFLVYIALKKMRQQLKSS